MDAATHGSLPLLGFQPGWLKRTLIVGLVLLPLVAAVFIELPVCPTAAAFGMPCPGCGLTRATLAALRGDFAAALRFHPLVFVATPLYLGVISTIAWSYVRGGTRAPPSQRLSRLVSVGAVSLLVLLFVVWLARFFGFFGGPVEVIRFR